jgi:hypothetical protein
MVFIWATLHLPKPRYHRSDRKNEVSGNFTKLADKLAGLWRQYGITCGLPVIREPFCLLTSYKESSTAMTTRCVLQVASKTLLALIVPCCAVGSQNQPGKTTATESGAARSNASASQVFSSSMYGMKFVYPPAYNFEAEHYTYLANPDFANDEGAVILGKVEIPPALYPGTNFSGGDFAVSVSPVITNIAACHQFASGESESTVTANGILYSVANNGTGGMGHWQSYKILHTYQNGFCYEFMFEIDGYNRGNLQDPSSVQEFSDAPKIQDTLLAGISFFRPAAKPPLQTAGRPKILSFSPSSDVAGVGMHNSITFRGQANMSTTSGCDSVARRAQSSSQTATARNAAVTLLHQSIA